MLQITQNWQCFCNNLLLGTVLIASLQQRVFAQITPDTTLPNNSSITPDGNTFNITGGTQTGSNLFHSFSEFSVPTDNIASFNNAVDIQNIITRVTGNSISDINGLIKANGNANLFLINPNGIVFGENARLEIGGSFLASTANSLKFGDGIEFSANAAQSQPLLSVNVPLGLQYGTNPGSINNQSRANNIEDESVGLEVNPGKTLALVGGDVELDGGKISAAGGRVELGGLAGAGTVELNGDGNNLSLSFPDGVERSDVTLTRSPRVNIRAVNDRSTSFNRGIRRISRSSISDAKVDVAAANGGTIAVNARNINILQRSSLHGGIKRNLGFNEAQAGDISLNATDTITLTNSFIRNTVESGATGNAGNIDITTGSIYVSDGAQLTTETLTQSSLPGNLTQGDAGNVNINARDIVSFDGEVSGIRSTTTGIFSGVGDRAVGNAGNINITAGSLDVSNKVEFDASNRATVGDAGGININTRETVSFDDMSTAVSRVESGNTGNGGNISITTKSFSASNGSQILAIALGEGNGGSININASNSVSFDGVGSDGRSSAAYSTVQPTAKGNAGDINIDTGSFSVTNGAELVTSTFGEGNGGSININASNSVSFDGVGSNERDSAAYSTVESNAKGNAGDINIDTGSLSVTNGALVTSRILGQGNAANININARDQVSLIGEDSQGRSSVVSSRVEEGGVKYSGGDINIETTSLSVSEGAVITASTDGKGNGGNVTINARDRVSFDGVGIDAVPSGAYSRVLRDAEGQGGSVTVNVSQGSLEVTNGAQISTSTLDRRDAGNIILNATTLEAFNGGQILTTSLRSGNAGDIIANISDTVTLAGSDSNYSERLERNLADGNDFSGAGPSSGLFANTAINSTGHGGDLNVNTEQLTVRDNAEVTVSSAGSGDAGSLTVNANSINLNNQGKLTGTTASGRGGNIKLDVEDLILMRNHSAIATTAANNGSGGNIEINSPFIIAVPTENSDIIADADQGSGGRITINATGIYGIEERPQQRTQFSDINASSNVAGLSGTVELNTPNIDPNSGLIELPTIPVDTEVRAGCYSPGYAQSSFTIIGRGGLPTNPKDILTPDTAQVDWVSVKPSNHKGSLPPVTTKPTTSTPKSIVEATGITLNAKGQIVLAANSSTITDNNSRKNPIKCHGN